jgi:Uma2 family endonuclease
MTSHLGDLGIVPRDYLPFSPRAEQTMGMPAAVRHHWTAEEVRNLQDESNAWPRYELIVGELYVTPSPGWWHNRVAFELAMILTPYARAAGIGDVLVSPSDIELDEESVLQPDVFVYPPMAVLDETTSWRDIRSLLLAIEVISPSSVRTDRTVKRDQYMRMPVDEYWVVDLDGRHVERWFKERANVEVARETLLWHPTGAAEPLTIDLPKLFIDVGLPKRPFA